MRPAVPSRGRRALVALAVLLGVLGTATPALAHAVLAGSTPQPGETVERLESVRLRFQLTLSAAASHSIRVLDPDGTRRDTGQVVVESDRVVSVAVAPGLRRTGQYTVRWCVLPVDGHRQAGAYQFSYAGPTVPDPVVLDPVASAAVTDPGRCAAAEAGGGAAAVTSWVLLAVVAGSVLFLVATAVAGRSGARRAGAPARVARSDAG